MASDSQFETSLARGDGDSPAAAESWTRTGILIVLSGPSGVGKDSVIKRLRGRFHDLTFAVTATTRAPRPGEVEGVSYFFVTDADYDAMVDRDELLAPAEVHGNRYGAPAGPIRDALYAGRDVLLKIDVQGAMQIRRRLPQAVFIFLAPVSMRDLVTRLAARHTESNADFERRVRDAQFEMEQLPHYDYVVVNRDDALEHTVNQVSCIITAERLRTRRQPIRLENH